MSESPNQPVPYATPLLDAVRLFEELGIGHALVGGIAAMVYGRARFTEDLDFVAASGHEQILARNSDAMKRHHFDPACTWKRHHESGVEVDIWKDQYADQIVSRAREIELAGRRIRIAEPNDLAAMKLRAGRIQDDYDISEMIKAGVLDEKVVKSRVTAEELARYQGIAARTKM